MAFGGQMHDDVGSRFRVGAIHRGAVAYVGLDEAIARIIFNVRK